jgi:hypothetical protein
VQSPILSVRPDDQLFAQPMEPDNGIPDNVRNRAVIAVLAHGHAGQVDFGTYSLSKNRCFFFPELAKLTTLYTLSPSPVRLSSQIVCFGGITAWQAGIGSGATAPATTTPRTSSRY